MVNLDYLYNPAAAKGILDKNSFVDKKLGFKVIEHGTVFPAKTGVVNGKKCHIHDGVFDNAGEFLAGTSTANGVIPVKITPPPRAKFV